MKTPEPPPNEPQRMAALRALRILDTGPEERFDRLTRLAQGLFDVPIALVTLVDASRQWFKSRQGLSISETPRDISFCGHAITETDILFVPDTHADPRFHDNPLVSGDPRIRFYAGCPLVSIDGSKLGTLCIIDRRPRELTPAQIQLLRDLAALVEKELNGVELTGELRRTFERMETVVRATNDAVWDWDLKTNRIWWGYGLKELFGYVLENNEADLAWWESHLHPEDGPRIIRELQELLASGGRSWSGDYRFQKKDGSYARILDRAIVLLGDDGKARRMIGAMVDVTKQKEIEEQFRQAQKMEAVGRLAGGVAHDFNNILTAILGYAELAGKSLKLPDGAREDMEEIVKSAQRAAALTRQLLVFSRKQVVQPKVLNLNAIAADMEKMLGRLIGENIKLSLRLSADLGSVKADPGSLEQLLLNLAVNARDAMPKGGTLTIRTANVEDDAPAAAVEGSAPPGRYVLLSVSDAGCGISPEIRAKIFEPFFTTKGEGKGTGLGLSTVHGIVKQSGGYIALESEVGRGTDFKIYFPRIDIAAKETPGAPPPPRSFQGAETILLVEDDSAVRGLAKRVLNSYGYTVLAAAGADAALQACLDHQGPIHLVLSDVVLPELNGGDLAEKIGSLRPESKFLFMTGYTDPEILEHKVFHSARIIQKPFQPEFLARTVHEVLDPRPDAAEPGQRS